MFKWSDYFGVPLIFFSVLVKSFIKILAGIIMGEVWPLLILSFPFFHLCFLK
jgi:hypothetical protein